MPDAHHRPAPDGRDSRRRRRRIHTALVLAVVVCPAAFGVELWRALSGNALSWAYVFEWPMLLGIAVYLWAVMLRQEAGAPPSRLAAAPVSEDDPDLVAWRRHLEEVEAAEARMKPATGAAEGT